MSQGIKEVLSAIVKFDGDTKITGDSGEVETKDGNYILRVQVDKRLGSPDYFSLDLLMMRDADFLVLDAIKPGTEIEVQVGYDDMGTIFKGEVSYLEPSFGQDRNVMTVSGYDLTHRLTRGTSSRTWGDGVQVTEDFVSVAKDVISGSKARKGGTGDGLSVTGGTPPPKREYVAHYEANDYSFLSSLGVLGSLSVRSKSAEGAEKLEFKEIDQSASPKITICRDKPDPRDARLALSADFTMSTVKQVARVEVRGWDPTKKEPILGFSEAVASPIEGKAGPEIANTAHYGSGSTGRTLTVTDVPVASKEEAEGIAKAIFESLAMDFLSAEVTVRGAPAVSSGDFVELKGFGTRYSGKYLVDGVQHVVVPGAAEPYVSRLSLKRNSAPEPS